MRTQWAEIEALDNKVAAEVQCACCSRDAGWWSAGRAGCSPTARGRSTSARPCTSSRRGAALQEALMRLLGASDVEPLMVQADELEQAGVPPGLAQRPAWRRCSRRSTSSRWPPRPSSTSSRSPPCTSGLGERLELHWLRDRIVALPRDDRWRALARAALRDDLYSLHRSLTAEVLRRRPQRRRLDRRQPGDGALPADARRDPRGHVFDTTTCRWPCARCATCCWRARCEPARPAGRLAASLLGGPGARLGRLDLAVLRRRVGDELAQQARRHPATSSTARSNASALACDGFVKPLILRTYCSAAARTSSSVAGGSKL